RDLQVPRAGGIRVGAPRGARGSSRAHRPGGVARRCAAGPRLGSSRRGRARGGHSGAHRAGGHAGVPRHLQRPAESILRSLAAGQPARQDRRADRDRARSRALARCGSWAAAVVRESGCDGGRERRVRHERPVPGRQDGAGVAQSRGPRGGGGAGTRRRRSELRRPGRHRSATPQHPLAIYYEHPDWFRPLFEELDRRRVPYVRLAAASHRFDTGDGRPPYALVFNRMSPSAYLRGAGNAIFYTLHYLAHLKRHGVRVINGYDAWVTETSKALQLSLLEQLGLPFPAARVINHAAQAPEAARGLRFPVVLKPNIGGAGAGVRRFETPEQLEQAAHIDVGGVEYLIDARDGRLYFYDINALSNFVADAPRVVGFDPFARLVDYLEREAA